MSSGFRVVPSDVPDASIRTSSLSLRETPCLWLNWLRESSLSQTLRESLTAGCEPMPQAEALYSLSLTVERHGLSIVCYTGFTLEQLHQRDDPHVERLLGLTGILIDGPYVEAKKANLLWRGSANQKVHFLSDMYSDFQPAVETERAGMEIIIGKESITLTGSLQEEVVRRLLEIAGVDGAK